MIYTFFTSVFITLFLLLGAWSFYGFVELMRKYYPLSWANYQHVIIITALAVICFIAACLFGTQIPDCYVPAIH